MILHLLFDSKFGEYAIRQFSEEIMCSRFAIIANSIPDYAEKYKYVRVIPEDGKEFTDLLCQLGNYKAIIFHGLFYPWQEKVLRVAPDTVKIAWVFWGGDLYGRQVIEKSFLSRSSKVMLSYHNLKRLLRGGPKLQQYEIPIDLFGKIDYCLTDIPEDFMFAQSYLKSDAKALWYNYYSIEETVGELAHSICNGTNVLVGNSCSLTCNHLDGFQVIRKMKLSTKTKVFIPLSYGEPWLKNVVSKLAKLFGGDQFIPLTTFLPREEYNLIIQSCSIVVMPHYRPQAFGNILTALWLGSRVFLSERNVLFSFFKRIGAIVFSVERDVNCSDFVLGPLSEDEIEQNRKVISLLYKKEVMYPRILDIVRVLNQ